MTVEIKSPLNPFGFVVGAIRDLIPSDEAAGIAAGWAVAYTRLNSTLNDVQVWFDPDTSTLRDRNGTPIAAPSQAPVSGDGLKRLGRGRVLLFTNSLSSGAYQDQATLTGTNYAFGMGAIRALNAMLGGPWTFDDLGDVADLGGSGQPLVQGVWCWGGRTSTTLLQYLPAALTAYRPQYVIGRLFENDVGGIPLADSVASLNAFLDAVIGAWAVPIVLTCVPRPFFTTAAHRDHFDKLYDACFDLCAKRGAICLDSSTAYLDHSSAWPIPLAGYADTGASGGHPNPRGNMRLAKSWLQQLRGVIEPVYRDIPGKIKGNAIIEINPNPTMVGAGGSPAGVSDSWTLSGVPAGATVTYATVTSGSRTVPKYSATYAGAATAANTLLFSLRTSSTTATGWVVGDKIQFEFETEFTSAPSNVRNLYAYIDAAGSVKQAACNLTDPAASGWVDEYPGGRCVWRTPIFNVPAGTTTLRVWIQVYIETGSTAASCDLVVHSAVVRKVPLAVA